MIPMFSRVIPSWEQIEQFRQPLTEGELHLLKFLDNNLKKDNLFQSDDLTQYNGWLIFVQPFLNGSRPDIIIMHPKIGVQIFEVKDWNLNNYSFESIRKGNKNEEGFCVSDSKGTYEVKSPIKQVEHYKEKIVSQLVPQIGEEFDTDTKLYGVIKTAVYFHKSTTQQVHEIFGHHPNFSKFPLIGYDALLESNLATVVPDSNMFKSKYWQQGWNNELLFWLNPPFHFIEQGTVLSLFADQKKFAEPQKGHHRVRGVAGSGKTQVLAYRTGKLASQGYRVLVLTYNITLWHLIHDMVQRSPFNFTWKNITFAHFHGFCKDILNEFDEVWPTDSNADRETIFREIVPNIIADNIKKNDYKKYDAILIDEGQDFYVEWYSLLCQFVTNRDEVVVVCDKKQNIYERKTEWLDKRRKGVEKFGDWIELKKIIRLPRRIANISVSFSEEFNLNQDIKIVKLEERDLFNQSLDHIIWWNRYNRKDDDWIDEVDRAFEIIKNQATNKHPSDTVILLPYTEWGIKCVQHFASQKNIKTNHVFENNEEQRHHRYKKAFWMGDSRLKMSTIHSFKGWEVSNVIVVIPPSINEDKEFYDSIVYTAITRPKENLIVINTSKRYWKFGEGIPEDEWSV